MKTTTRERDPITRRKASLISKIPHFLCGAACVALLGQAIPHRATTARPELVLQNGHTADVDDLAFSPDGNLLASASRDNTVKIWSAQRRLLRTLRGHTGMVLAVAFSRDGSTIASGGLDDGVRLWSISDGRLVRTLKAPSKGATPHVVSLAFSPDGNTLASMHMDKTVRLWSASDGRLLHSIEAHTFKAERVVFSPDGKSVASAGDSAVRLWSVENGRLLRTLQENEQDRVTDVAFSPDGKVLASRGSRGVKLWSTSEGRPVRVLPESAGVNGVVFGPDGQTVAGADHGMIRLWSASGGAVLPGLEGPKVTFRRVAFSPDGRTIAAAGESPTLMLWSVDGRPVREFQANTMAVFAVSFSPDGRVAASATMDNTVILWSAADGRLLRSLKAKGNPDIEWDSAIVRDTAFSPDGTLLASLSDEAVNLWSVPDGRLLRPLRNNSRSALHAVAWSPDGRLVAAASDDNTLQLWSVSDGRPLRTLRDSSPLRRVKFSPNGQVIATASFEAVKLWRAADGRLLRTLAGKCSEGGLAFVQGGGTLACSDTGGVTLWSVSEGRLLRTMKVGAINVMSFSPDGKVLASAVSGGYGVKLWSVPDGRLLRSLEGHSGDVRSVVFSPDGRTIASGSFDTSVRLWSVATAQPLATLVAFRDGSGLTHTPDGYYLGAAAPNAVAFRQGLRAYSFEQFDLRYNRPDLVLSRISGSAIEKDADLRQRTARYREYWKYRVKQNGFDPTVIESQRVHAPEVYDIKIDGLPRDPPKIGPGRYGPGAPATTTKRTVEVSFKVRDEDGSGLPVVGYRIYVNGVPIDGQYIKREKPARVLTVTRTVKLSANGLRPPVGDADAEVGYASPGGENEIEISGMTSDGVESSRESVVLRYTGPVEEKPKLYVITLGIDDYSKAKGFQSLRYAVKDAEELRDLFSLKGVSRYGGLFPLTLKNGEVNRDSIRRIAAHLKTTEVDDTVIVFLSGHGFRARTPPDQANAMLRLAYGDALPPTLRYMEPGSIFYYMTGDSSSDRPWEKAIPLDMIRMMLDNIPARQKVLFIDACNSGEDPTTVGNEPSQYAKDAAARGVALLEKEYPDRARGWARGEGDRRGVVLRIAMSIDQREMSDLFPELRRGNGTIEISASTASQSAYEGVTGPDGKPIANGAFTHTIKEALSGDEPVSVGALRRYVFENVGKLTGGRQQPMASRDLAGRDFVIVGR